MYKRVKQLTLNIPVLRKITGVVFVLFGLIALITPLTPGALILIVVGLELLGFEILFIEKIKQKFSHNSKNKY